jgi:hypothetical protein
MEACLSAHFVSRALRQLGHQPGIIPAIYVKPFVKGQKHDYNDAEAVAEAALRPNLRVVREKTQDQFDLLAPGRPKPAAVCAPIMWMSSSEPSTKRPCIGFAPAWSRGERRPSIRSVPF